MPPIGRCVTQIAHFPADRQRVATAGTRRRGQRCHRQVDDRRDQVDGHRGAEIVGFGIGLDGVAAVGAHTEIAGLGVADGQPERDILRVALAGLQFAGVLEVAKHQVVAIADELVGAQNDLIAPCTARLYLAAIGDGPADLGQLTPNGGLRRVGVFDAQIGVGPGGGGEEDAGAVVALGVAVGVGLEDHADAGPALIGGHCQLDVAAALDAFRQKQTEAALAVLAGA